MAPYLNITSIDTFVIQVHCVREDAHLLTDFQRVESRILAVQLVACLLARIHSNRLSMVVLNPKSLLAPFDLGDRAARC